VKAINAFPSFGGCGLPDRPKEEDFYAVYHMFQKKLCSFVLLSKTIMFLCPFVQKNIMFFCPFV